VEDKLAKEEEELDAAEGDGGKVSDGSGEKTRLVSGTDLGLTDSTLN
jgi:hypothetical protein